MSEPKGIIDAFWKFFSEEPLCCQLWLRFALLSLLCTAFGLTPFTMFNLRLIFEEEEYWRIFLYPLAEESVFSNFWSLFCGYICIKKVTAYVGTLYTFLVLVLTYFSLPLICFLFVPSCQSGYIPWDMITLSGVWSFTFVFLHLR
eukprot:UN24552